MNSKNKKYLLVFFSFLFVFSGLVAQEKKDFILEKAKEYCSDLMKNKEIKPLEIVKCIEIRENFLKKWYKECPVVENDPLGRKKCKDRYKSELEESCQKIKSKKKCLSKEFSKGTKQCKFENGLCRSVFSGNSIKGYNTNDDD